jgi:hypothetical protein
LDDIPRGYALASSRPIAAFACAAQIGGANLDSALQCRRAGKHVRANPIGRQRPTANARYIAGRDPWVHREVPIGPAHHHRAVHHYGATEKFRTSIEWQQYRRNTRRN